MKKYTIIVLVLWYSIIAQAQTKKEVQFSLDTLIKANNSLQVDYIQLKDEWNTYNQFFMHVKDEFFPAEDINMPIDEAINRFDELHEGVEKQLIKFSNVNIELRDSIAKLSKLNVELEMENNFYKKLVTNALNESYHPKSEEELIGNWNLFLTPLSIKGEPFESGLVGISIFDLVDSISKYNIFKIEIQEEELANLYFSDGTKQKCFYSISEFSSKSPYSIYFSKQEEFKMVLRISPMATGLMVSYEIPVNSDRVLYYYGLMKRN